MVGLQSLDLPIGVRIPVSQPFFMEDWHETEIRVRYAETDAMGIVHHANYLVWFEAARSEFCRSRGFSYKEMEDEEDAFMVVAESYCRYKSPAYYEDVLIIRTKVGEMRSRSLRFIYEVYRPSDDMLIAEGETLHLVTDREKNVRKIPDLYRSRLMDTPEQAFPANQAPS
jgi:acyl-CoA thioester hydrolase